MLSRTVDRRAHFRPGLDAELFGDPLLKGAHGEHGRYHRRLARPNDLEKIHAAECAGIDYAAMPVGTELDGYLIVSARIDLPGDRFDARARHVSRTEQAQL